MTTLQEALLPCPFCGGPVKLELANITRDHIYGDRHWYGVVCRNTTNHGGTCCMDQVPSASKEAAIARWNTRTALVQQELPQKERPDFMAGYDAGMADAKRMAQQGATKNCPQPEICGSKECEFCRDTVAPKVKGDGS